MKKILILASLSVIGLLFVSGLVNAETPLTDCGTLNVAGETYVLQNDVNSSGTCFTVTANDVTLDGNGKLITYGQNGAGNQYGVSVNGFDRFTLKNANIVEGNTVGSSQHGVFLTKSNYDLIQNNKIDVKGAYAVGVNLLSVSENNVISSNTITTSGANGRGIRLFGQPGSPSVNLNNVTNNKVVATGSSSYGIYVYTYANSNNIENNEVTMLGSGPGIFVEYSDSNKVANNKVSTSGLSGNGIYITYSSNNNITSNTITASATSASGIVLSASSGNNMVSNTIITSGVGGNGIRLGSDCANNTVSQNDITTSGQEAYGIHLYVTRSNPNIVTSNNVLTTGANGYGLYIYKSAGSKIESNKITTTNTGAYGICLDGSPGIPTADNSISLNTLDISKADRIYVVNTTPNNSFTKNNILNRNYDYFDLKFDFASDGNWFIDQYLENYTFLQHGNQINVKASNFGQISIFASGTGTNFSNDFKIENNLAYIASSQLGNGSIKITLYNLPTNINPVVFKNGAPCESACSNFVLNAGIATFDVTSPGSYSIGGCGNGLIDTGEQCDDGNRIDGDGCSSTCTIEAPLCQPVISTLLSGNAKLKAIDTACCVKKGASGLLTFDDPTSDEDTHGDYVSCVVLEAKNQGLTGKTTPSRGDVAQTAAQSSVNMPANSNQAMASNVALAALSGGSLTGLAALVVSVIALFFAFRKK